MSQQNPDQNFTTNFPNINFITFSHQVLSYLQDFHPKLQKFPCYMPRTPNPPWFVRHSDIWCRAPIMKPLTSLYNFLRLPITSTVLVQIFSPSPYAQTLSIFAQLRLSGTSVENYPTFRQTLQLSSSGWVYNGWEFMEALYTAGSGRALPLHQSAPPNPTRHRLRSVSSSYVPQNLWSLFKRSFRRKFHKNPPCAN
jgi:hypothetical protein